jgi:hypothetical protein
MWVHYRDCDYIHLSVLLSTCIRAHLYTFGMREWKHGGMEEWESDLVSAEYLVFYTEKRFPSQLLAAIIASQAPRVEVLPSVFVRYLLNFLPTLLTIVFTGVFLALSHCYDSKYRPLRLSHD